MQDLDSEREEQRRKKQRRFFWVEAQKKNINVPQLPKDQRKTNFIRT
jgi:hypothetical protein